MTYNAIWIAVHQAFARLPIKMYLAIGLLILLLLLIDLFIPLGVAGGVPYVVVILLALWIPGKRHPIYLALICSILTIAGYSFSPSGGELWQVLMNRALALFVIWVTAILVRLWKVEKEKNSALEAEREQAKEEIYQAMVHSAQHILNNLLNQLQIVRLEAKASSDFDPKVISHLVEMTDEANILMKTLSQLEEPSEEEIRLSVHPITVLQKTDSGFDDREHLTH